MKHSNDYDFIGLLAATMVIVGHAYALLVLPGILGIFRVSVSTYAVKVFFVLSGYLVVMSWVNDPHVGRFIAMRALRIMPALTGAVELSAVFMGSMVTTLSCKTQSNNGPQKRLRFAVSNVSAYGSK